MTLCKFFNNNYCQSSKKYASLLTKGGGTVIATGSPPNLYNNTRMIASTLLHRECIGKQIYEGRSSDFPPLYDGLLAQTDNGFLMVGQP